MLDNEFNGSIASGETEAAAAATVAAYESELRVKQGAAVAAWEKEVAAGLGGGALSLEGLKALVANGASAFNVNVKYLGSSGRSARLAELHGSLQIASAWHDKCNELLARPTGPEVLLTLIAEGESIPLKLAEVGELRTRLERIRSWADGAAQVMRGSCELKELQELQREAEALRIRTPESEALATRTVRHAARPIPGLPPRHGPRNTARATRPARHGPLDGRRCAAALTRAMRSFSAQAACRKWTTRIHNELLRRKSSRKAEGARLSCADVETLLAEAESLQLDAVEIEHAQERLAEARMWAVEAAAVLDPPVTVTPRVLAVLNDLATRAENLNMLLEHQADLESRLGLVRAWIVRAKAAMADSSSTWQLLTGLVKEARSNKFDMPEVPLLAEQQAEQAWLGQAEEAIDGPAQLEDLEQLDADAHRLAESGRAEDMAHKIHAKLLAARRWAERLGEEVSESSRPGIKEASTLLAEADGDKILLPALDQLRSAVSRAKTWLESVRRTQSRSTRGFATRATLPELRELFQVGQGLRISLPEVCRAQPNATASAPPPVMRRSRVGRCSWRRLGRSRCRYTKPRSGNIGLRPRCACRRQTLPPPPPPPLTRPMLLTATEQRSARRYVSSCS